MEDLFNKGVYYVKDTHEKGTREKPVIRLWHNCSKYKRKRINAETGEPMKGYWKVRAARVELNTVGKSKGLINFVCSYCGFECAIDEHKNLTFQS